ncbi:hypothetical protein PybrP1_010438 [[Pythium] brassicae (nom. inval.)]|nr:hypothetical protein PybrP1_010438 [[Pythium] brassicae (nom. inval.)]
MGVVRPQLGCCLTSQIAGREDVLLTDFKCKRERCRDHDGQAELLRVCSSQVCACHDGADDVKPNAARSPTHSHPSRHSNRVISTSSTCRTHMLPGALTCSSQPRPHRYKNSFCTGSACLCKSCFLGSRARVCGGWLCCHYRSIKSLVLEGSGTTSEHCRGLERKPPNFNELVVPRVRSLQARVLATNQRDLCHQRQERCPRSLHGDTHAALLRHDRTQPTYAVKMNSRLSKHGITPAKTAAQGLATQASLVKAAQSPVDRSTLSQCQVTASC